MRSLLLVATKASSLNPRSVIARSRISGPNSEYTDRCLVSIFTFHNSCRSLTVSFEILVSLRCHPSRWLLPLCVTHSAPRSGTATSARRIVHFINLGMNRPQPDSHQPLVTSARRYFVDRYRFKSRRSKYEPILACVDLRGIESRHLLEIV